MNASETKRGRFITLEGGEGVGKSTQVRALAEALERRALEVVVTREPGGTPGAERIRELLLGAGAQWDARAEALLFAAARADHVERLIAPALASGRWVLCDRFLDSSLAYQGGAGGLGVARVRSVNAFAIGETMPDRSLVLWLDDGAERARARDGGRADAIGARPADYHHKVGAAFQALAAEEPDRLRLVDASGTPDAVTARLLDAIADLIP